MWEAFWRIVESYIDKFNFGTEFVMCQSIPNGGGGEVENTNGTTGHVLILNISFLRYFKTQNDN